MTNVEVESTFIMHSPFLGNNLKNYIEKIGRTSDWLIKRSGLTEEEYADLTKGNYSTERLSKLNELLRIKNPIYFLSENIVLPKSLSELEAEASKMDELLPETSAETYAFNPLEEGDIGNQIVELMKKHGIDHQTLLGNDLLEIVIAANHKERLIRDIINIVEKV